MARHDLLSPAFFADPDPVLHRMRAADPVYWEPTLEAWVLTRYRDVRRVLNDDRFTVNRSARIRTATPPAARAQLAECYRFLSRWMIFSDEPRHGAVRRTVGPFYTPGAVRELEQLVDGLVDDLMAKAAKRGSLDVIEDLAAPLTGITNAVRIGFPAELVPDVRRWSDDVFLLFGSGIVTEETVDAAHASLVECDAYVRELVATRELAGEDTLVGRLLRELSGARLDEEEAVASCVMLLIGGHEAARHMIGNCVLALARNPAELAKLRARPELMDQAMEELLRYDAPPVSALRCAKQDVELDGRLISAGEFVFNMLRAANRDPEIYADPDRLDLERAGPQHLGFGYGRHFCTGSSLAPLQVKAALRALIAWDLELDEAPLSWVPSLSSRGLRSLHVKLSRPVARAAASSS